MLSITVLMIETIRFWYGKFRQHQRQTCSKQDDDDEDNIENFNIIEENDADHHHDYEWITNKSIIYDDLKKIFEPELPVFQSVSNEHHRHHHHHRYCNCSKCCNFNLNTNVSQQQQQQLLTEISIGDEKHVRIPNGTTTTRFVSNTIAFALFFSLLLLFESNLAIVSRHHQ